jgi:hypothetical protein
MLALHIIVCGINGNVSITYNCMWQFNIWCITYWRKQDNTTDLSQVTDKLYRVHLAMNGVQTRNLMVIGIDCTCSCISNYHTITTASTQLVWLATGRWYYPVSSMNKTEILLKVALNTINHKPTSFDTCINFIFGNWKYFS